MKLSCCQKFADAGATGAAIDAGLALWGGHAMSVVGLPRGSSPAPDAEALKFIGDELVVGRILQRQELQGEAMSFGWPALGTVADALAEQIRR